MSINVYTGSLNYQNAEYQFVFHDDELHLIPPPEVAENILWGYERKEIAPGVYTSGDPLRMKESVLVGRCRENNKYIFFLVRKNAQLGCQNDVLIVPLIAHFMCHNSKPFISRICFYGPELNHIHPVNQALCYTLDADHFFNDGTFSLATRSHEFTTTSKQQFLVDGNNVTVSFDIRRDFSSKISDAPVHLNSALTFEFNPSDNYMFLLRLYNIAKRFIQFLCYRADINISTTNLYELTDDFAFQIPYGAQSGGDLFVSSTKRKELATIVEQHSCNYPLQKYVALFFAIRLIQLFAAPYSSG